MVKKKLVQQKTNSSKRIEKFEDAIEIIDRLLAARERTWKLKAVVWFDFEDVKQKIRIHIAKKWDQWDKSRPIEPWINVIITRQMINEIRNNYKSFARPCLECPNKDCENQCSLSQDGSPIKSCEAYAKWEKRGKRACDVKLTLPIQNHLQDIYKNPAQNTESFDLNTSIDNLNSEMHKILSVKQYNIYKMLFIDKIDEEYLASVMNWKTNEKNRKAGYNQILNLKKYFMGLAKKIIAEKDILY